MDFFQTMQLSINKILNLKGFQPFYNFLVLFFCLRNFFICFFNFKIYFFLVKFVFFIINLYPVLQIFILFSFLKTRRWWSIIEFNPFWLFGSLFLNVHPEIVFIVYNNMFFSFELFFLLFNFLNLFPYFIYEWRCF
jgi:hypothetical protein